jgi:drug/metabolite transporter (DMT)-like permease
VLVLILSSGLWAIGSFYTPRISLPANVFAATAWQMLLGGAATLLIALAVGEGGDVDPSRFSTDSILAFAYLVLAGGLLSYAAFMWLLRNAPISKVATHAYVNPVIAVFLGWLILEEQVTITIILGAAAVVASVALVVGRDSTRRERAAV